jgi:hypothetical protein
VSRSIGGGWARAPVSGSFGGGWARATASGSVAGGGGGGPGSVARGMWAARRQRKEMK